MSSTLIDAVCANDHSSAVEILIQAAKEDIRHFVQQAPYKHMPVLMVKQLVAVSTRNLNQLPAENGIQTSTVHLPSQ